jgi:hypothetical protein
MKKKGTSDLLVFGFYSCPSDVLSDFFCSDLRVVLISLFSANIFSVMDYWVLCHLMI